MRKHRKSTAKLLLATIVLTVGMGLTSYAEENPEIKAAVQRATDAGAGSYQDQYISGGWKIYVRTEMNVRATKDENGMIISPTSGIVYKYGKIDMQFKNAGSDRSIHLSYDPSGGNLQPNWIYNPLGKTMDAPPIICMDKNSYNDIGWTLTSTDYNTGEVTRRMDTCDTSGSWVYNPNPTGTAERFGISGELSGWMYRYADGTYAANGTIYIYDSSANNPSNDDGPYMVGIGYAFNENGFLITNTAKNSTYVNEFGQVCDGTIGPFGTLWYYTK